MYKDAPHSLSVRSASRNSKKSLDTVSLGSEHSIPSVYASTIWSLENESTKKIPRLNDQQWIMHRKKIGLSRKTKRTKANKEFKNSLENINSFIEQNFKRKECVNYVPDPQGTQVASRPRPCHCGATEREHRSFSQHKKHHLYHQNTIIEESEEEEGGTDHGIKFKIDAPESVGKEDWKPHLSIREFPTNAFGNIEFDGSISMGSRFIRLSIDTDMIKVKQFINDYSDWMNPRPRLAIGIIGGAQNFRLEGRKKETFKTGLIGALKATNGWVLTAGTDTGVMKLVGEAVEEGQFIVTDGGNVRRGIKAIGLVNWGMVEDNQELIRREETGEGMFTVHYSGSNDIQPDQPVPLNPNHTFFILIDTGYRYTFKGTAPFITKFEKMISATAPHGLGIPVVNIIIEGGLGALYEVEEFVARGQMMVVVEGTGRMADIISTAIKHATNGDMSTNTRAVVKSMLMEAFGDKIAEQEQAGKMEKYLGMIENTLKHQNLISVFDIRTENNLDNVILTSLLKGNDMNLYSQLYLALVWDRLDIAEEKIFSNRSFEMRQEFLDELMMKALVMGRKTFVEALVINGFSMGNFLTVEVLRELYQEHFDSGQPIAEQIEKFVGATNKLYLRHIHKYFQYVLKKHKNSNYELDVPPTKQISEDVNKNAKKTFQHPFFELFLWAVLTRKKELLDYFWERSGCPILSAMTAGAIYQVLVENFQLEYDVVTLQHLSFHWVGRANRIMEIAMSKDKIRAVGLVEMPNKRFDSLSLMRLAFNGNLRGFINNPTCQESIRINWQRGLVSMRTIPSIIAIFVPILVWTRLFVFLPLGDDGGSLSPFQKLFVFYKAPIVKFYSNCISYSLLVLLYTYVALFNYTRQFLVPELVVYAWIAILLLDDVRQLVGQPAKKLKSKVKDHFDIWNKLDLLIFLLTIVSVVLKSFPETFSIARVVFATNNMVLYFRILRIFHISFDVGPKVVILFNMLPELVSFLFLLIIFILAYGTGSQALLSPQSSLQVDNLWSILEKVVWLPYWQMYGELSLDTLVPYQQQPANGGNMTCPADVNCENLQLYSYVIPFFFGAYLLIGNVMLLNLLIAIFTSVYDQVSDHSREVWRWEMFRLLSEYDTKPGLAPPLVIIEDVWKLLKFIWKRTCRRKREDLESMMISDLEMLSLFEKDCLHDFLLKENNSREAINDLRLSKLEDSVHKVLRLLEEEPELPLTDTVDSEMKKQTNISSRIFTAKVRSQTAKTKETLAGLEKRFSKANDETKIALESIEQTLEIIKDSLHDSHKHHHSFGDGEKSKKRSKKAK